MPPVIRYAAVDDLEAVVAIYNESIPGRLATADTHPVTAESRRGWFEAHSPERRPLWLAEVDGAVAGWLSLSDFYGRPAYQATVEVSVYVDTAHHRRGVGRALLQQALAASPGLGVTSLVGYVFGHNAPSLALFEGFGFTRWGHLPAIAELDGRPCDLVIVGRRV